MLTVVQTLIARLRHLIRNFPNTTTLFVAMIAVAIVGVAVPDAVAVWLLLFLLGAVMGFAIVCMVQLERISRRGRSR